MEKVGLAIIGAFVTLFLASIIIFIAATSSPGGTLSLYSMPLIPTDYDDLILEHDLDNPPTVNYINWVSKIMTGDFGMSIVRRVSVIELLQSRVPATIELVALSLIMTALLSLLIPVLNQIKIGGIFAGIPVFWIAILLVLYLGVSFNIDWARGGRCDIRSNLRTPCGEVLILQRLEYLILPVIVIVLAMLGRVWLRQRANGYKLPQQNVTLAAMDTGFMMFTLTIVEQIFSWPGAGQLFFSSLMQRDYPVAVGSFFSLLILGLVIGTTAQIIWNFVSDSGSESHGNYNPGYTPYSPVETNNQPGYNDPGEPDYSVFDDPEILMQEQSEPPTFEQVMNADEPLDVSSFMADTASPSPMMDYTQYKTKSSQNLSLTEALKNPAVILALIVIAVCLILLPVLTGISGLDPQEVNPRLSFLAPGSEGHMLGTDQLGRDTATRLLTGINTSLGVAVGAALLATIGGFALAALSHAAPGLKPIVRNFGRAMPAGLLTMFLLSLFHFEVQMLTILIGLVLMPSVADFLMGDNRNPTKSAIPVAGVLLVFVVEVFLLETALSFVGFGIFPPMVSLGGMLSEAQMIFRRSSFYVVIVGFTIMLIATLIIYGGRWMMQQNDN